MDRKINKRIFFIPLVFLLLGTLSNADELSVESLDGTCEVTVKSNFTRSLLEEQIQQNCTGATELSITGIEVEVISTSFCTLLPNLTHLSVYRTFADQFDGDFEENECEFLKVLVLHFNLLTNLPSNGFRALKNLEILNLKMNQLENLPSNSFLDLKNLKTLDLSLNQLENLDSGIFMGLEKLTTLVLSHNQLSQLPADLFKPLINLESLNLQGNSLRILDLNLIATNAKINNICCNECQLTTIIPSKTGLSSLEWLELANNDNLSLDGIEFENLTNLTLLDLGQVSLSKNLDFLEIFPTSLTQLYLYHNSSGIFDLNRLRHLVNLTNLSIVLTGLQTLNLETVPLLFPKMKEIAIWASEFSEDQSKAMQEICDSIKINCNIRN